MTIKYFSIISLLSIYMICFTSCVQKAYDQKITLTVDVSKIDTTIFKVGVRGNDQPMSWEQDLPMKEIIKDSIYQVDFAIHTGYKFTEFKFVVNDDFELKDQANRKLYFEDDQKTIYKAIFNSNN